MTNESLNINDNARPDVELLMELLRKKKISMADAKMWISLPLIAIPSQRTGQDNNDFPAYVAKWVAENPPYDFVNVVEEFLNNNFYFEDFVLQLDNAFVRVAVYKTAGKIIFSTIDDITGSGKGPKFTRFSFQHNGKSGEPARVLFTALSENLIAAQLSRVLDTNSFLSAGVEVLMQCSLFRDYNNQKDRYAIRVAEQRKPKVKGLPTPKEILRSSQGPRVIYLDALPTQKGNNCNTSDSVREHRPHHRRGTWITLRAERFKYHPKYMVKNGVYRKPTWVGPREAIVNGNIYTVIE